MSDRYDPHPHLKCGRMDLTPCFLRDPDGSDPICCPETRAENGCFLVVANPQNQCDGCRQGLPSRRSQSGSTPNHYVPDGSYRELPAMGCTAHLYLEAK